jgi:hypothetical protein
MKNYWWVLWLISALGVWALPSGFAYSVPWFLAWLGIALALRRWERRRLSNL